jgi:phospholipid-binding lipoprotein MlaA
MLSPDAVNADTAVGGIGAEVDPMPENPYPDLLDDEDGMSAPDLLDQDPFLDEPEQLLGDPIFEDDFTFTDSPAEIYDPLEPMNRAIFVFNDKVYFWVLKPTKNAYSYALPSDIRRIIGNAFSNLAAPIRLLNNVLQGKFEDAGVVLSRFAINSTLGVFGFGDPAYVDFDLEPRPADFGQTLGKWKVGEGFYLCLPFLGPSNVRDTVGFVGDIYMHPVPYFSQNFTFDMTYLVTSRVNLLSISPDVYEELKRISLDPYVAARQGYYDYRRSIIEP